MNTLVYVAKDQSVVSLAALVVGKVGACMVTITIPDGASVEVIDDGGPCSLDISLVLGKGSQVQCRAQLVAREGHVERTMRAVCREREGVATLFIVCHTEGSGSITLTTIQDHGASHTHSSVRIMGVSEQVSRATVSSTIHIEKNQKEVVARQVHKHLLLDVGARAVSVPALDILSDDVSCSHGSAITHLNASHLFYLQARGYDKKMARDAVVKAFLAN